MSEKMSKFQPLLAYQAAQIALLKKNGRKTTINERRDILRRWKELSEDERNKWKAHAIANNKESKVEEITSEFTAEIPVLAPEEKTKANAVETASDIKGAQVNCYIREIASQYNLPRKDLHRIWKECKSASCKDCGSR